jgi:hypothetical protein
MSAIAEALVRAITNLVGRLDGPMHFRFIVQPTVAILLGVRAGIRDARLGQPPFLGALFWEREHRHERMGEAWKDTRTVFLVALVLDVIYQLGVHGGVFALELAITPTLLAFVPYSLVRGPACRIARMMSGPKPRPAA